MPNPADVLWLTRAGAIDRVFAEIKHLVLPMLSEARNLRGAARVKAKEKQVVVGGTWSSPPTHIHMLTPTSHMYVPVVSN